MTSLPWIDWTDAERAGLELVKPGPSVSRAERSQVVAELRADAARATGIITEASGLPVAGEARELVIDRPNILRANIATARTIFNDFGVQPDGAADRLAGRVRGASIGGVLALITSRILGQYDPFGAQPTLYLVAPTIVAVERQLKVKPADFRMWVALHEQTHRVQFANAPWLREHLLGQTRAIIESVDEPVWRDLGQRWEQVRKDRAAGRPTSLRLVNAVSSPDMVAAIDEVSAVMSLLEGHADLMMDRAAKGVIGSVDTIRARFDARRARGGVFALVNKLMGMDAKLAQYADGARFCRRVVEVGGLELLNRAFTAPAALPSLAELLDPHAWCDRVGGTAEPEPGPDGEA